MTRVLVCGEERHTLRLIETNLKRQGYAVRLLLDHRRILETLKSEEFGIIVIFGSSLNPTAQEIDAEIASDPGISGVKVIIWDREPVDFDSFFGGGLGGPPAVFA